MNCKERILQGKSNQDIWDFEPKKLVKIFNKCIELGQKYKMEYERTKKKAGEFVKSRQWDFDDAVIFHQLKFFIKRIKKLIELFVTIE